MLPQHTQTKEYWVEGFQIDRADIDHLYNVLLERETPLSADEMTLLLMRYRVQREEEELFKKAVPDNAYQPRNHFEVNDEIVFPSMGYKSGKVIDARPGENPDYGDFTVIKVAFEKDKVLEFASDLTIEHALNVDVHDLKKEDTSLLSPETLFIEYGGEVADVLQEALEEHDDLVHMAGRWFPRSLLIETNIGHLNLAEAVLDMNGGGPMTLHEILDQLGLREEIDDQLAEFSMNYNLQEDERFDEVGPAGQVVWYLARMEPEDVLNTPSWLAYTPIPYDADLLTEELCQIETEIGDEHSPTIKRRAPIPESVTVTLTYPHRHAGTLPLTPQLRQMFPTAYVTSRIRFILVDAQTGDEYPAWVVRTDGYVYGLKEWLERHDILVGSYLTIRRTDDPGKVQIDYGRRKPRKEWVLTAWIDGDRLRLENRQRSVGCEYDDLMIVDVEDTDEVDTHWQRLTRRNVPLERLLEDLFHEIGALTPQGHVHAKTLYSTVNLIRRCPPGPIFAHLVAQPQFKHVGGPYWHLGDASPLD